MKLAIITAHAGASCLGEAMLSWGGKVPVFLQNGSDGILPAFQRGYEATTGFDILAYFHDDLLLKDSTWEDRVLIEFQEPRVGLCGFGGARGHGSPDIYSVPYEYRQMGRSSFMSNMIDAEAHGIRITDSRAAAVLDGFSLIIRRSILNTTKGWPVDTPVGYVGFDYWISLMTRRLGFQIKVIGVPVIHLGGQTFVKLGLGQGPEHWQQFLDAHEYLYSEFKDVLPFHV